jgi:HlyD family secretion protein
LVGNFQVIFQYSTMTTIMSRRQNPLLQTQFSALVTLGVAVLAASLTGCGKGSGIEPGASSASTAEPKVTRVVVGRPVRKPLVLVTTQPARIEAYEETPLYAKVASYVDEVAVDIGDAVKKGQTLITLRIPELQNAVDQRQALLTQAKAQIAQAEAAELAARAAADTATAHVKEAEAGVGRASADHERWEAEHLRIASLAKSGSVTPKLAEETKNQLRAAESSRDEATAAVESAEAAVREAEAMIAKSEADLQAAEARAAVAEADLAEAKTMLSYRELQAPFDGVVISRGVDPGHFVQPASGVGAKPLAAVASTDRMRVSLDVPEMEAAFVDVGDPVVLRVQALRGAEIKGKVARISWSLDAGNRSLRAEVDVPNDDLALRPGMYATGVIELDRRVEALTLPATAIVRNGVEAICMIIEDGVAKRFPVELGLRVGADVEIVSGLTEANDVITIRPEALADGQPVEPLPPTTSK